MVWLCQTGEKCCEIAKIIGTANRASSIEAAYSEHSIAIHSISMAGYVTAVPAFVCGELPAQEVSNKFLRFFKTDLLRFHRLFLLFKSSKPCCVFLCAS